MFSALLLRLGSLMVLRAGPQDLPSSSTVLRGAGAAFVLTTVLQVAPLAGIAAGAGFGLLGLVMYGGFVRMMLSARKLPERYTQTLTALLLSNALLGLLMLIPLHQLGPAVAALAQPQADPASVQLPQGPVNAMRLISLWGLIVGGHIFRHALNVNLGIGICVTLFYQLLLFMVVVVAAVLTFSVT